MQTFAFVDGGATTAEYLWRNGIRPSHILFSLADLEESIAYCDAAEDNILCIIQGCTTLTLTGARDLMRLLEGSDLAENSTVFSNIPIYVPQLDYNYVFYSGDLCYGTEYIVNTKDKFDLSKIKPFKGKKGVRIIDDFKVDEADEDSVDLGELPKKHYSVEYDSVSRSDIIQLDIFK